MNMHRFVEREENSGGEIKNELIIYVNLILQAILKEKQKRKKTPASLATFSSYSRSQTKVRNPWTRIINFKKRHIYVYVCVCVVIFYGIKEILILQQASTRRASTSNVRKLFYVRII